MLRHCWILCSAVLLMTAASPGAAKPSPPRCSLVDLGPCESTNALVGLPGFPQALGTFLGDREASYLYPHGSVLEQAFAVLGGPPDRPEAFGNLYRFTACRLHSCTEKGAVVLTAQGQIMAVAILHSACAAPRAPNRCFAHETLTLFLHRDADRELITENLSRWAKAATAAQYVSPGFPRDALDAVNVTIVTPGQ